MGSCRCPNLSVQYGNIRVDQIHRLSALCQLDDSHHGVGFGVPASNTSPVAGAFSPVCKVLSGGKLSESVPFSANG